MNKPLIVIPLGDPAGIGPEIVAQALEHPQLHEICRPLVVGSSNILKLAQDLCACHRPQHIITDNNSISDYQPNYINIVDISSVNLSDFQFCQIKAEYGQAAYEYIKAATSICQRIPNSAMATTPINKEALRAAAVPHIGHTEILAELTQTANPLTMFQVHSLRVFFLSRHVSLRQACEFITCDRMYDFIITCNKAMVKLGLTNARMAVAGLNPHCGEHGLFGNEEGLFITPAINKAHSLGLNIHGPIGADSVFHQALHGRYDAVLSLYHDQGHIATKTLDFERTIAITLNLPFLRTSVDHGTAFDIAGKGKASPISMIEAIKIAVQYQQA